MFQSRWLYHTQTLKFIQIIITCEWACSTTQIHIVNILPMNSEGKFSQNSDLIIFLLNLNEVKTYGKR